MSTAPGTFRLPCGAWLYTVARVPTSVNARRLRTPLDPAVLAAEVRAATGVACTVRPWFGEGALKRLDWDDDDEPMRPRCWVVDVVG